RSPRIDHRLLALVGLAAGLNPCETGFEHGDDVARAEVLRGHLFRGTEESGAEEGAGGSAHGRHEGRGDKLENVTGVRGLSVCQLRLDGRESTIQVLAVVAVPDGAIELDELDPMLGGHLDAAVDPG